MAKKSGRNSEATVRRAVPLYWLPNQATQLILRNHNHMHSATIIRCFMLIYSLTIKSVKCTLNFSFKLIFSGFSVFICFLDLLTRTLRRVYINGFSRNNGLSLR